MTSEEEIEITPIALEELRADASGSLIRRMAAMAYESFRQPPWNDDRQPPRLHLGLGVDLMRRDAMAFVARSGSSGRLVGYVLGYEVVHASDDTRDVTLAQLAGSHALDHLCDGGRRVFYGDTLCVDARHRRLGIGYRLSLTLIERLRASGYAYRIGRTSTAAGAMRALYEKLGFEELAVRDATYPERTYWLKRL